MRKYSITRDGLIRKLVRFKGIISQIDNYDGMIDDVLSRALLRPADFSIYNIPRWRAGVSF